MSKVIIVGEALIDVVDKIPYVGGACLNVACYLKDKAIFYTKIGDDEYGKMIYKCLSYFDVDTKYVYIDKKVNTPYSIVEVDKDGERHFTFNFDKASFYELSPSEINIDKFNKNDIFCFGSVFLSSVNGIECIKYCLNHACEINMRIAFDLNYRDKIFPDKDKFKKLINQFISYVDILKVNLGEYDLLFSNMSYKDIFNKLPKLKILLITLGNKGAKIITKDLKEYYKEGKKVDVIDTIGCGDSFFATILSDILESNFLSDCNFDEMLKNAIDVSSKVASTKGALMYNK